LLFWSHEGFLSPIHLSVYSTGIGHPCNIQLFCLVCYCSLHLGWLLHTLLLLSKRIWLCFFSFWGQWSVTSGNDERHHPLFPFWID
jgi:hypothetical protein